MRWLLLPIVALLSGCGGPLLFFVIAFDHERAVGDGSLGASDRAVHGGLLPAPELAPDRKVNEQDCTKPIDWSLGNLRCK